MNVRRGEVGEPFSLPDEMATAAQEGAEMEGVGMAVGWVGWRPPGTTTSPKPNTEKG